MQRESTFKHFNIADGIAQVLFVTSLIVLLSPYLAGYDFGIFKIPVFSDQVKDVLKWLGPILFSLSVLSFFPLWKAAPTDKAEVALQVEPLQVSKDRFYEQVVEPFFAEIQDVIEDYFRIFRDVRDAFDIEEMGSLGTDDLGADLVAFNKKATIEIRKRREQFLTDGIKYKQQAKAMLKVSKDKLVKEFASNVLELFSIPEGHLFVFNPIGSPASILVDIFRDIELEATVEPESLRDYVEACLLHFEIKWTEVSRSFSELKLAQQKDSCK